MARVKRGNVARKRRNKVLALAKGFRGASSKLFRIANQQVMKALRYAYVGRKRKKREFRSLWITRINAASRAEGIKYLLFGQILKKIAQRAMNLQSTEGLSFYEFTEIADEQQFKINYKAALDGLPVTSDGAQQIVAEANVAFNLNMKVFQELETSFFRIIIRIVMNYINGFMTQVTGPSSNSN